MHAWALTLVYSTAGEQKRLYLHDPLRNISLVVLSHHVPEKLAKGETAFTFVTDGPESAITQAKAAAGDKNVVVGGGANTAEQFISAELIDELQIHLVPVLLGEGLRLFDHTGSKPIKLEKTGVVDAPDVTHLTFWVVK